jgi:hypothetical protein
MGPPAFQCQCTLLHPCFHLNVPSADDAAALKPLNPTVNMAGSCKYPLSSISLQDSEAKSDRKGYKKNSIFGPCGFMTSLARFHRLMQQNPTLHCKRQLLF